MTWTKDKYKQFVQQTLTDIMELVAKKNADYACGDDPFANFRISSNVGVEPLTGLWIRM